VLYRLFAKKLTCRLGQFARLAEALQHDRSEVDSVFDFKPVIIATLTLLCVSAISQSASAAISEGQSGSCPAPGEIDWSKVPGPSNSGPNDVSRDFVNVPDPLNTLLSNDFTAWNPQQREINGALTSTGKAQRLAVVGTSSKQAQAIFENPDSSQRNCGNV